MANEKVVLEIDPSNITTVQDEPKKRNFVYRDPYWSNKDAKHMIVTLEYEDGRKSTGLIAQELEKVLPEVVYDTHEIDNDDEKFKAVRYGNVVGLLVEAIKELKAEVKELKEVK